ncbi:hypothetical protein PJI17_25410 [Mycobacterium kansasii]
MTSSSQPPPTTPARPISARNATAQPAATTANPDSRARQEPPEAVTYSCIQAGLEPWSGSVAAGSIPSPSSSTAFYDGAQRHTPTGPSRLPAAKVVTRRADLRSRGYSTRTAARGVRRARYPLSRARR